MKTAVVLKHMRSTVVGIVVVAISACSGSIVVEDDGGTGGGTAQGGGTTTGGGAAQGGGGGTSTGGGTGSGGGMVIGDGGLSGLPCDVSTVVATHCVSCHGTPPTQSAPMPLDSADDFRAASLIDPSKSFGARSVLRMRDTVSPMPPGVHLPSGLVDVVAGWVSAGMPDTTCEGGSDAGIDAGIPDAGPPMSTCLSNQSRPAPTSSNAHGASTMAPGYACIACHSGQNFNGQNPGGLRKSSEIFQFMGTVFREPNAQDLCVPALTTSAQVEIYNSAGTKVKTMTVNSGGNFYGSVSGAMPSPYTAKVVTSAGNRAMTTAQTNGDCNSCHTVFGLQNAPGRIVLP